MSLVLLLAVLAADPPRAVSADVPIDRVADWTFCRNEKGSVSFDDEMKGCEALIVADDVDNEIKAIAHANRGMLMAQARFFETAKTELDEAIKLNPRLAPAYYNRAMVMDATGNQAGAIADYSSAIAIFPNMLEAYVNRGIARAKSGQRELALADFTKAIELEPGNPDNYNNRAMLLRAMGRATEADADLAKARSLGLER